MKLGPRLLPVPREASLGLLSLTEGAIHMLECFKDRVGVLSCGCISCSQGIKHALCVSPAPRDHVFG